MDEPDYYYTGGVPDGPTGWNEAAFLEEMDKTNAHIVFCSLMQETGLQREWIWRGAKEYKHNQEMMDDCMGRPHRDMWKTVLVTWLWAMRQGHINIRGWIIFWYHKYSHSVFDAQTIRGSVWHANNRHLRRLAEARRSDVRRSVRIRETKRLVNYYEPES